MEQSDKQKKKGRGFTFDILYLVAAVVMILLLRTVWNTAQMGQEIPYSQFQQWLAAGKISDLTVGDKTISGTYGADKKAETPGKIPQDQRIGLQDTLPIPAMYSCD